jgi:biopolymer transport protein ExbD
MSWKVRHEGSSRAVENLSLPQVIEGLQEGAWDSTDEVMGPQDTRWIPFESHPQFTEVLLDIEPPPPRTYDDETRLDMTALIDVCLVLLVFFILTTSYAAIQKMLDLPGMRTEGPFVRKLTKEAVDKYLIKVEARMDKDPNGNEVPAIKVEGERVEPNREALVAALGRYQVATKKTELLLDHSPRVPHGVVVMIQDCARGARLDRVTLLVPKDELGR